MRQSFLAGRDGRIVTLMIADLLAQSLPSPARIFLTIREFVKSGWT
jgi:hypothetical protein